MRIIILLILTSALSVVTSSAMAESNSGVAKLKVGAILTLSGKFSSAGEDCRKGIEAGVALGGFPIEVSYADSKNDPTTAISEYRRLTTLDNVAAVYTHRSSIGMALNPISRQSRTPLLGAVGNKDFAAQNDFALQVWPRSDEEGYFLANELIKRGLRRAALVYTEDEWTTAVSAAFREKYLSLGGSLVLDQAALPAEADFHTLLAQIKQRAPQAIFVNMLLPQLSPIVKQARELEVPGQIYSNFYMGKPEVRDALGADGLENVRYAELDSNLPALRAQLNLPGNASPAGLTVASYLSMLAIAQVLKENPSAQSPAALHTALLSLKEIRTPDRSYPIRDRCVVLPLVIRVFHGGVAATSE